MKTAKHTAAHPNPRLAMPTDLGANAAKDIAGALNVLLADTFALYLKTKNFHWHVSGPHFRDYHLLLEEQAEQIFAMTNVLAERVRKIGQPALRSIGDISRRQRLADNDAAYVDPDDMLTETRYDNQRLVAAMREAHDTHDEHNDVAPRACSKSISTGPSVASGSCMRLADAAIRPGIILALLPLPLAGRGSGCGAFRPQNCGQAPSPRPPSAVDLSPRTRGEVTQD